MKRFVFLFMSLSLSWPALAHPGHGNTPWHAILHMLQDHGVWIGLLFLVILASLVYRAWDNRNQEIGSHQERQRDSR